MTIQSIQFNKELFSSETGLITINGSVGSRIGFYREGSNYVFTTEALETSRKLNTNIKEISKILSIYSASPLADNLSNFHNYEIITQYLHRVNEIITKRNTTCEQVKNKKIINFLLKLPLISLVIKNHLKSLNEPLNLVKDIFTKTFTSGLPVKYTDSFKQKLDTLPLNDFLPGPFKVDIDKLKTIKTILFCFETTALVKEKYFTGITENELLEQRHSILDQIKTVRENYKDASFVDEIKTLCTDAENSINQAMLNKLIDVIPALTKAVEINQSLNNTYTTLLNINESSTTEQARDACNPVLRSLSLSEALGSLPFVLEISTKAKEATKRVYGQWHAQRLIAIQNQCKASNTRAQIEQVFGSADKTLFQKKFDSIYTILIKEPDSLESKEALEFLMKAYEQYFLALLEDLISIAEKENNSPVDPSKFYNKALTAPDLIIQNEFYTTLLKDFDNFEEKSTKPPREKFFPKGKAILDKLLIEELKKLVPHYEKACRIIQLFDFQNGDSKALVSLKKLNTAKEIPVKSFNWCKMELQNLEIVDESLPEIILKAVQEAKKLLETHCAELKAQELKENAKKQTVIPKKTHPNFFNKIKQFFNKNKNRLIDHEAYLMDLLKVKKPSEIDEKYHETVRLLSKAHSLNDEVISSLEALEDAHINYKRSLELAPLVEAISKKQKTLSFNQLFPLSNEDTSMEYLENHKNQLLAMIAEEEDLYPSDPNNNTLSPQLKQLQKLKAMIESSWDTLLIQRFPFVSEMKKILKDYKDYASIDNNISKQLFLSTLKIVLGDSVIKARQAYEEQLKILNYSKGIECLPPSIQESLIKARDVLLFAYKEWEAERVLNAVAIIEKNTKTQFSSLDILSRILGIEITMSAADKVKRYKYLQLLLHPDKNRDTPEPINSKIASACKAVSNAYTQSSKD